MRYEKIEWQIGTENENKKFHTASQRKKGELIRNFSA